MQNDAVRKFLFGDAEMERSNGRVSASMIMDADKEGWVGIPHGGIGMGALLEMASDFEHCVFNDDFRYPVQCSFRMGGSEVRVGDLVTVAASQTRTGISGSITPNGSDRPYITADIGFGNDKPETDGAHTRYIPDNFAVMSGRLEHIPYYLNCFVCGVERKVPGLKRRFHLWESPHGKIACAFSGFSQEDRKTMHRFSRNGCLHPVALLAVLDETMGWGGFFAFAQGGVSVRLKYTLLRKIGIDEKVIFFGRGERVKGHIDKRMLFWASGGGAVVREDGTFEVVVISSGQWYAVKALTQQMRNELIPKAWNERIFSIAEASREGAA